MSKSLEYFISTPHWLDALTQPLEGHIAKLADTVEALKIARDSRWVPPPPEPGRQPPWPPASPPREIPPLVPPYRPKKRGLIAVGIAFAALAVLYPTVLRKAPPEIVAVDFPASIGASSRNVVGTVQFKTGHDAIAQAQFDVVEAQSFDPFTIQPRGIAGQKQGSFSFSIHSSIPQQVTLKATLIDAEGRRSSPVSFSFEAKKPSGQNRGFEIETPQGFKFKIPK